MPVSDNTAPAHKDVGDAPILTIVGWSFTVTAAEVTALLVQPAPVYVTDKVYTPPDAVVVGVKVALLVAVVVL